MRTGLRVAAGANAIVCALGGFSHAQVNDEFVGVSALIRLRTLVYSTGHFPNTTAFLGEPIDLVTTLRNRTRQEIVSADGRDWADHLTIAIQRGPDPAQGVSTARTDRRASPAPAPTTTIAPRNAATATFGVGRQDGNDIPPGQYSVRVALAAASLDRVGPRFTDRLEAVVPFEVRAVQTLEERLDYHLHRVFRARLSGAWAQEESEAREVLKLHPHSAAARSDLADLWRRRRNCGRARTESGQALGILLAGTDTYLKMGRTAIEHWIAGLEGLNASCRD